MIVVMRNNATQEQLDHVIDKIRELGYQADVEHGTFKNVLGVIGDTRAGGRDVLEVMPGVERVIPICWSEHPHIVHELGTVACLRWETGYAVTASPLSPPTGAKVNGS